MSGKVIDIDNRLFLGTWNEEAVKAAYDPSTKPADKAYVVYAASKTLGEKTAWKWVEEHKPQFIFNAVLPNLNVRIDWCPVPVTSADNRVRLRPAKFSTRTWAVRLWEWSEGFWRATTDLWISTHLVSHFGLIQPNYLDIVTTSSDKAKFKNFSEYFVDVVDVARLHAIALLAPNVKSERIFAFAGPLNLTEVLSTLRELRPDHKLPDPPADEGQDFTEIVPAARAEKLLQDFFGQKGWTPYKQSIAAGIRGL